MAKLTDEQIEGFIEEVNGTLAIEEMALTEEDKEILRDIQKGRYTLEEAIQERIRRLQVDG